MSADAERRERNARNLSQLMRLQERLLGQLQEVRDELSTPATRRILKHVGERCGSGAEESFGRITAAVEEAIRSLKVFESEVRQELFADETEEPTVEGIPDLPPRLARFLAERTKLEGFSYEVRQDPVRGWVICWKEHAPNGTIRGYGQIYERPHAWIDD